MARMVRSMTARKISACSGGRARTGLFSHWGLGSPRSWRPLPRGRGKVSGREHVMLRRVAFAKAILAGVAGAFAWEAASRLLILLNVPLFDLVHVLGTIVHPEARPAEWWPVGMLAHAAVGAIWAI